MFTNQEKKVIDIKKKSETLEPARSKASSLSHPNIPAALEGRRQQTSEASQRGREGGGHKICMLEETRWT